jgi:hypothetical protein
MTQNLKLHKINTRNSELKIINFNFEIKYIEIS